MLRFPTIANDPSRKGQLAAPKQTFGEFRRYAVAPLHTRFDAITWFVWDAHEATLFVVTWIGEADGPYANSCCIREAGRALAGDQQFDLSLLAKVKRT